MGINGMGRPKIIINVDSTQDEIELYNWVTLDDSEEVDISEVKAPRTGKKVFTKNGKHRTFKGKIFIYKYLDPSAAYSAFKSYEGMNVYLYPHNDGDPFLDEEGERCLFKLVSVNEAYTDPTNKYDVLILTFQSIKRIRTNILHPISPSDIEDLYLWFAPETLENPSSNLFTWTDKVSGIKSLQGDFGTGDGISNINGIPALHSIHSTNTNNNLNGGSILNFPAFTFIGIFQHDLPQGTEDYRNHIWEQLNINPHTTFSQGANVSGGSGSAGLKLRAQNGFTVNISIGISTASGGALGTIPPHKLSLIVIRVIYGETIEYIINGSKYSGDFSGSTQYAIEKYYLNNSSSGSQYWNGLIGEFLFYKRNLTDSEINYLAFKFKQDYAVEWSDI